MVLLLQLLDLSAPSLNIVGLELLEGTRAFLIQLLKLLEFLLFCLALGKNGARGLLQFFLHLGQ